MSISLVCCLVSCLSRWLRVVPLQDLSAWSINGGHETDERATCPLPWKKNTRCYPNAVPTSNDVSRPLDQHLSLLLPHHARLYHRSGSSWKSFGHVAAIQNNWQILDKARGLSVFGQIICLQVARFCWRNCSLKTDVPVFIGHRNKMAPWGFYRDTLVIRARTSVLGPTWFSEAAYIKITVRKWI